MSRVLTLHDALVRAAETDAGITYLDGDREQRFSYEALYGRALQVLGAMQRHGIQPGASVVFQLDGNQQLVEAFWACQLGGFTPVPLNAGGTDEHLAKTLQVISQMDQPDLVTQGRNPERLWEYARRQGTYDDFAACFGNALDMEQISANSEVGEVFESKPQSIATIQYSSGSTGAPKGVLLTHTNLLTDIDAIIAAAAMDSSDRHLSWVPLTHDLGMVMFHLLPVVLGVDQYLMPSSRFARRPLAWLELASATEATVLCSPNFGYQHWLKAFAKTDHSTIDLSNVRVIFNGGEPISQRLCDEFTATLSPYGLAQSAIRPAYGLAEACVCLSMTELGSRVASIAINRGELRVGDPIVYLKPGDRDSVDVVCVGKPVQDCELQIVNDNGVPLGDDHYGRIRARGGMVSPGYYGSELINDRSDWLDTGDLGFIHESSLYIIGRAKDVVIVNGVNYHPADLEQVVCQAMELELGKLTCCGVFAEDGRRELLLVYLVHRQSAAEFLPLANQVKRILGEHAQLEVDHVLPLRTMPKTTSGKIQRYELAQRFIDGEFDVVLKELEELNASRSDDADYSELERTLHGIFNGVIPDVRIQREDNFMDVGVSSLSLAEVLEEIDVVYPNALELDDFLDHQTIAALSGLLERRVREG
ncbi:MAG: AMP-binding protein [Pseudomonadales bacterium]|nr:AMP-binding protein [Pseudomonadales bacterium]